jgi:hypothetical protein
MGSYRPRLKAIRVAQRIPVAHGKAVHGAAGDHPGRDALRENY